jgi:hypothetical protein
VNCVLQLDEDPDIVALYLRLVSEKHTERRGMHGTELGNRTSIYVFPKG